MGQRWEFPWKRCSIGEDERSEGKIGGRKRAEEGGSGEGGSNRARERSKLVSKVVREEGSNGWMDTSREVP